MKRDKRTNNMFRFFNRLSGTYLLMILVAGIFLFSPGAWAAPLNLELADDPDIMSDWINVSYNAETQRFTANGVAMTYYDGNTQEDINGGNFEISAIIDNDGNLISGNLTIGGTVPTLTGLNSGTLLIGELNGEYFGFGANLLEFTFTPNGGDAKDDFIAVNPLGGVLLTYGMFSSFPGSFTNNFSNLGMGYCDTAPVPIPGAIWLLGSGLIGLLGFRRKLQ